MTTQNLKVTVGSFVLAWTSRTTFKNQVMNCPTPRDLWNGKESVGFTEYDLNDLHVLLLSIANDTPTRADVSQVNDDAALACAKLWIFSLG